MPPKYYCDYCDKTFHDTPASRRRHVRGSSHQIQKKIWFDSFSDKEDMRQGVCAYYVRTGFCQFGDRCKFSHPTPPESVNIQNNTSNLSAGGGMMGLAFTSPGVGPIVGEATPTVLESKLPPSLQPPPEGGYPPFVLVDWG